MVKLSQGTLEAMYITLTSTLKNPIVRYLKWEIKNCVFHFSVMLTTIGKLIFFSYLDIQNPSSMKNVTNTPYIHRKVDVVYFKPHSKFIFSIHLHV